MTLAVELSSRRSQGMMPNVSRSGSRNMSLSWMRAKPSMLDPSNHRPFSTASPNLWNGMWTFLTTPMMSVNCRLTNRTLAALACSNTSSLSAALSVSCMAISIYLSELWRAAAQGGPNLQRELDVESHLGVFEIGATQQLLDALES